MNERKAANPQASVGRPVSVLFEAQVLYGIEKRLAGGGQRRRASSRVQAKPSNKRSR